MKFCAKNVQNLCLDNGLNLICYNIKDLPLITFNLWVRVGSYNETPKTNGISHFLEHMLFKDTKHYANNSISRVIEDIGGYFNAATSLDYTHFYITLLAKEWEKAPLILSEIAYGLKINEKALDKERLVVIEEIVRAKDSPWHMLWDNLYKNAFKSHPYGMSIAGEKENIINISALDMMNYYKKFYNPANMILAVAGDMRDKRFFDVINKCFNKHINREEINGDGSLFASKREPSPFISMPVTQTYFAYAWHVPNICEDGHYDMKVIAKILGDGITSRLYKELKHEKRYVWSIGADLSQHKHGTLLVIYGTCDYNKKKFITKEIEKHIKRVIEEDVTQDELEKVKNMMNIDYWTSLETSAQITDSIGYYATIGDFRIVFEILDKIKKVNNESIKKFAKLFLGKPSVKVLVKPGSKYVSRG